MHGECVGKARARILEIEKKWYGLQWRKGGRAAGINRQADGQAR